MKKLLASLQWMIFILASSIVAPIAVGNAFEMTTIEIAGLLQRSFFMVGLGSLLQTIFGHKLPIAEGPAGLWWGVFLLFANIGSAMKIDAVETLQSLQLGLLVSGCIFIVLGLFGLVDKVRKIFTPMVTGIYLFLLVAQLSSSFIKAVMGIGYLTPGFDGKVFISALAVIFFTFIVSKSKYLFLKNYAILFGIVFGWLLFTLLGLTKAMDASAPSIVALPKVLVWGVPKLNGGIILTSSITALLLLSNLIASIEVVRKQVDSPPPNNNRAGFVMGINQILNGLFSAVGMVPVSISAGFIAATKIREKRAFVVGSILITLISFFPPITLFFASIPSPVAFAVKFITFTTLVLMAFNEFSTIKDPGRKQILAISLIVGLGSMFIPSTALSNVPVFLVSILNNGLILGVIICIALEQGLVAFGSRKINRQD